MALLPHRELQQRLHQHRRLGRVADGHRPVQRRPQVVPLLRQHPDAFEVAGTLELAVRPLGHLGVVREVPVAPDDDLASLVEAFLAVLTQCLEQRVAGVGTSPVGDDHGLVDQSSQQVGHGLMVDALIRAHRADGSDVAATREHRQPVEQQPLVLGEQLVGPLHRRPQRLVALRPATTAALQQPEAVRQLVGEIAECHRTDPSGGQLDGQRKAVQAVADRGDHRQVGVRRRERGVRRCGPLAEQLHPALRRRQGRHWPHPLRGHADRLAARGQQRNRGTGGRDPRRQPGDRIQDVLAVVQDQQHPAAAEGVRHGFGHGHVLLAADRQHAGDGVGDRVGACHRRQLHRPDAVGEPVDQGPRQLRRQSGLPDAADAGECDESALGDLADEVAQFVFAAYEACERRGDVATAGVFGGLVDGDGVLEGGEIVGRVEAGLIPQTAPVLARRPQRVSLAAAAMQPDHQGPPGPLPVRMVRRDRPRLAHRRLAATQRQQGLGVGLPGMEAQLFQPRRLPLRPPLLSELGERVAPPQAQRRLQPRQRRLGTLRKARQRIAKGRLETLHVGGAGFRA